MPEPDLKTLLTQQDTPVGFVNFLSAHSAIENYNFYRAVEKFREQCRRANSTEKGAPTQADVRKLAEHICKQYLDPDAPEEVNAEGSLKLRTVSAIVGPKERAKVTTLEFSDDLKKSDLSASVARLNFLGTTRISAPGSGLTSQSADVFTIHRKLSGVPPIEPTHPSSAPSSPSILDEHVFDEVQRCIFHLLSTSIYPNYVLERAGAPISGPLTISPTGSQSSRKEGSRKTSPRAASTSPPKFPAELQQFIDSCRGGHPGRGKGRGKRTRMRANVHGHDHAFIVDSVISDEFSLTATTSELDMVLSQQQQPKKKGKEREQAHHIADEGTISIASTSHSPSHAGEFDVPAVDGAVAAVKPRKTSFPGKIISRLRTLRVLRGRISGSGASSATQSGSFDGSASKTSVGKGAAGNVSNSDKNA